MFNGWKITNILDVGLCELDTADGPYNKTGYRLEHREDGFAIPAGLDRIMDARRGGRTKAKHTARPSLTPRRRS